MDILTPVLVKTILPRKRRGQGERGREVRKESGKRDRDRQRIKLDPVPTALTMNLRIKGYL